MKIKPGHIRDFWAYVKFNRKVNGRFGNPTYFCPDEYHFDRGEGNTIKCFVEYESTGKMKLSPRQPKLLKLAFDGKKILNWHIEQWAEGKVDCTLTRQELNECFEGLPLWVEDAVQKQIRKLEKKAMIFFQETK